MPKISACLLIIRYEIRTIIFAWSLTVSTLVSSRFQVGFINLIVSSLGGYFLSLAIYIFNALMDVGEDKVNSPDRPLASGSASREDAMSLMSLALGVALLASFFINTLTTIFFVAAFILGVFYSCPPFRAKNHFVGKIVIPVVGAAVCSLTGAAVAGNINVVVVLASIVFAIFSLVTLFLGDVADLKGDLAAGIFTLSAQVGAVNTIKITLALPLIAAMLGLLLYPNTGLNPLFPLLLLISAIYSSLTIMELLGKSGDTNACRSVKARMRWMHLVMQLCFIIGVTDWPRNPAI